MKLVTAIGHATTACDVAAANSERAGYQAMGELFRATKAVLIERRELLDAAPELLEVARLLVKSSAEGTDAWPAIIAAQAAIAKAEGQS